MAGLQSGSPNAWGALYESYSARVWRYVARLLGTDQDAAPVDVTFLDRLGDRTAAEFVDAVEVTAASDSPAQRAADSVVISSGKGRTMLTLTARPALSITVAAIRC